MFICFFLCFFSSFHSFFFSLSFFIVFVRKCTKFFVLVMQKLRNFTSFLRSVRAYSLNRILVSFEIVNPEFNEVINNIGETGALLFTVKTLEHGCHLQKEEKM